MLQMATIETVTLSLYKEVRSRDPEGQWMFDLLCSLIRGPGTVILIMMITAQTKMEPWPLSPTTLVTGD